MKNTCQHNLWIDQPLSLLIRLGCFDQKFSWYDEPVQRKVQKTSFWLNICFVLFFKVMKCTMYHWPDSFHLILPVFSFSSFLMAGSGELSERARQLQQPSIDRGHSHCSDQAAASTQQGTQPPSDAVSPQQSASTPFHYCWILIQEPASWPVDFIFKFTHSFSFEIDTQSVFTVLTVHFF